MIYPNGPSVFLSNLSTQHDDIITFPSREHDATTLDDNGSNLAHTTLAL